MSFPSTTTGLYCPGCAPSDFPQPHICGLFTQTLTPGYCYRCNQPWTGQHVCITAWQGSTPSAPVLPTPPPVPAVSACDHCWCLKQKAGWYDVPNPTKFFSKELQRLKAHKVCCNCGGRRLTHPKAEDD